MKKSIFKEFKQDEIAKLSNIVGGVQEPTTEDGQSDTYSGDSTSSDDLTPSGIGDQTDWVRDVVCDPSTSVGLGGGIHPDLNGPTPIPAPPVP